jgi:outer membrane protein, multidrug efflux system
MNTLPLPFISPQPSFTPLKASRTVRLSALALAALLGACASSVKVPDAQAVQQAQAVKPAAAWQSPLPHGGSPVQLAQWWSQTDPLLGQLIESAQRESATLAGAVTRIMRARESLARSSSALTPDASLAGSSVRGVQTPKAAPATNSSVAVQASWEIDLFGKNRAQRDAAELRSRTAEIGWHEARVSVAAEVATVYYALRYCEQLVDVLRQDATSRAEVARLAELTARAGLAAPATSELARASSADAQNQLRATQAQCEAQLKALVALTAIDEPELREKIKPKQGLAQSQSTSPAIFSIASVPAQLIEQRPDVASAQLSVAAAAKDAQAVDAQRYPMLSLSGSIGAASLRSSGVTLDGRTWSLGPLQLTLPLTNQRVTEASTRAAVSAYEESAAQLRAAVRNAVREVEEALVNLEAARDRSAQAQLAASGYRTSFDATQSRYRAGLASLTELEDARRTALLAQQSQINVERDRVSVLISLYRAAGGGWRADTPLPDILSGRASQP